MKDLNARFEAWWRRQNEGLPLMYVVAQNENAPKFPKAESPEALWTDADYLIRRMRADIAQRSYLADAYPSFSADLGPGSLALYLGAKPRFAWDTVWYDKCIEDLAEHPKLAFDPENPWWKLHYELIKTAKQALGGVCLVDMPDIIENIDIYAAMRGTEEALYDLMDDPELVAQRIGEIDDAYFHYYDAFRELIAEPDGSQGYTCFHIRGKGRVAKIQCDFSAMLSPGQFRQFVLPSLKKQTERLDHSLYHLDGKDAIRHVPAIMELSKLDALQWTCGAGQPDGACPNWDVIYDQVTQAGKSLWIQLYDGGVQNWIAGAERLMNRYGKQRLYFIFPDMAMRDAEILLTHAEKHWK
jgi:5-methyltetrahydrofolate--homocysteine methyltransferase